MTTDRSGEIRHLDQRRIWKVSPVQRMSAQGTVDLTGIFGSAETDRLPERDAGQHGDDRYDHVGVRSLLRAGIVDALVAGHLDEADHGRVAVSGVPVRAAQPLDKDEFE